MVEALERVPGQTPLNVILVLTDDHRYDALGFLGHPFLETPHLDSLAREGVHFANAFVTTSLCSPSCATILTGLYTHRHHVVDNNHPVPPGTVFFPQYLQRAGYETAFIGKWHMGNEGDAPEPGFDHWVSFRGQGSYRPTPAGLNVDGQHVPQKGYITGELTDYAMEWLEERTGERPFFLYLSHKAVHADFVPAERHAGRYRDAPFIAPQTMAPPKPEAGWPRWTRDQRNSWHGVDFAYHSRLDVAEYYRRSLETLLAVDESVGRLLELLRRRGWLERTLVISLGDNGFAFGEHGLIDKRTAYEESMRIPMLMRVPGAKPGTTIRKLVANLDIAPTVLEAAGLRPPAGLDGASVLPLGRRRAVRPRGRSPGEPQPDRRPRASRPRPADERAAVRSARGHRGHGDPALAGPGMAVQPETRGPRRPGWVPTVADRGRPQPAAELAAAERALRLVRAAVARARRAGEPPPRQVRDRTGPDQTPQLPP